MAIHSQHSGMYHEARAMRLESNDPDSRQLVVERPLKSFDETVTFPAAAATRWSLTLTAGPSEMLVLRGLRFFDGDEEVCPHMVPYQESSSVAQAAESE